MGFFSDLKEDLSQAVNELMPDEALDAAMTDSHEMETVLSDGRQAGEAPVEEEAPGTADSFDISSMLDKLEEPPKEADSMDDMSDAAWRTGEDMPRTDVPDGTEGTGPEETEEPAEELFEEKPIPTTEMEEELPAEQEVAAETKMEEEYILSQPDEEEEETMDTQTSRVAVDETAVVTEGMTITGDIMTQGSMELIGTVNGNLDIYGKLNITGTIQGNSKAAEIYAEGAKIVGEVNSYGSVKIGQSSVIIGNISATSAVIAGAVKGDIDVRGPVILDTTAIVMGNIKSKSVQINNGAVIEGLCSQCYADISPSTFFEEFKKRK